MSKQTQAKAKPNKFKHFFISIGGYFKSLTPYTKNKLINCLFYIVGLFLILGINYCVIFGAFVPKFFILDLLLMILSVSPIFFFKGTMFDRIWIPIIMLLVVILITINVNYYKFFKVTFALKDLYTAFNNMTQVTTRIGQLNWLMIGVNVGLYGLFVAGLLVFNIKFRFNETKKNKNPKRMNISIFAGSLMFCSLVTYEFSLGMWTIAEENRGVESIKYVNYHTKHHFSNLGMTSYYIKELRQIMFDKGASDSTIDEYLSNSYKVDDGYTNTLSDPNIFVILVETGDRLMVNPYTTPNLCNIFGKEGVYGQHSFAYNHTDVSNMLAMTGAYPSQPVHQNRPLYLPFSLPQQLKAQGYNNRFYYDGIKSQDSYNNMYFIPTLGFDNCFWHDEILPGTKPWHYVNDDYTLDTVVADGILNNLKELHKTRTNKIYCHWMTMLMHMENRPSSGNTELTEKLNTLYGPTLDKLEQEGKWTNPCTKEEAKKRYRFWTLKTMDFDRALGNIYDYFYKSNDPNLNNTMIVAFGDHSWFEFVDGKDMAAWGKGVEDIDNINLYSTVLGMYHPQLKSLIESDTTGLFESTNKHYLNRLTTPACITPTILDLMGINYNPNIYMDKSIFDLSTKNKFNKVEDDTVFYSNMLNLYMNENYTSDDGSSIRKVIDENNTQDIFKQKITNKTKQLRVLDGIYYNDFFKRYDYSKYLPSNTIKYSCKEQAIVKYY